ncbi:hypothetical protein D3C76_1516050 [compost metagenome]
MTGSPRIQGVKAVASGAAQAMQLILHIPGEAGANLMQTYSYLTIAFRLTYQAKSTIARTHTEV